MSKLLQAALLWLTKSIGPQVLVSLGLGFLTYTGLTQITATIFDNLHTSMQSLPAKVLMLLGLAGFDQYLTIVVSGITTVIALKATGVTIGKTK